MTDDVLISVVATVSYLPFSFLTGKLHHSLIKKSPSEPEKDTKKVQLVKAFT